MTTISRNTVCQPIPSLQNLLARGSEVEADWKKIEPTVLGELIKQLMVYLRENDLASAALCAPAENKCQPAPNFSDKAADPSGVKSTFSATVNPCGISAASNGAIAANPVPSPPGSAQPQVRSLVPAAPAPSTTGTARSQAGSLAPAAPAPSSTGTAQSSRKHAWKGVSEDMWSEINAQRNAFGDSMDSQSRINSIPNTGTVLYPADVDKINSTLRNSDVVVLKGGVYNIKETIVLNGKTLVGAEGETVIINGSQVRSLTPNDGLGVAIKMGDNSNLKNINLEDADNQGIVAGNNNNIYQVSVQRTGRNGGSSTNGRGIISGSNNLLVSVEVANSYNYRTWDGKTSDGTNTAGGGNGDGILSGANTHIDVHSHNNSDDGIDVWEGGKNYFYFTLSYENGKSPLGMPNNQTGDGNGFKLGRGSSTHYIYKSQALNNKQSGFDQNGNTSSAVIVASESVNNGASNYAQGAFLSNNSPARDLGVPIGGLRK
jgi:hypothetical protein